MSNLYAYRVLMNVLMWDGMRPKSFIVAATDVEDAQDVAIDQCEANGWAHGDVLDICQIHTNQPTVNV